MLVKRPNQACWSDTTTCPTGYDMLFQVKNERKTMKKLLEMTDVDGMTVLMHASSSSCPAAFQVLSQHVQASQVKPGSKAV